jgi:hypothetical protein
MGASGSKIENAHATLGVALNQGQQLAATSMKAYRDAQHMYRGAGVSGGGRDCGCFGGDEKSTSTVLQSMKDYEYSLAAQTKERVVRSLARALKRAGIDVGDAETADLQDIGKALLAKLPNPKANGRTFPADAKTQEKACRAIADVLNEEFSAGASAKNKLIDTSAGPEGICAQISNWAHSYMKGVSLEFMEVHAGIHRSLRNIEILDQVMANAYTKVMNDVEAHGSERLSSEVRSYDEVFRRATAMRKVQEETLKNFLSVDLSPAQKELEQAMRSEDESHNLISKLGVKLGSQGFSDALAMAISGLGSLAVMSERVHRALKSVGAKARTYVDSKDFAAFRAEIDAKMPSLKKEEVGEFFKSVEELRQNFGSRADMRGELEALESKVGGADEPQSDMMKRVEKQKLERRVILRDFTVKLTAGSNEVMGALLAITKHLGTEIPITERTDQLRDAVVRLRDNQQSGTRIELALSGLYVDTEAREKRENYINALKLINGAVDSIVELEIYRPSAAHFTKLRGAIDSLIRTVDVYADLITKKYGGDDESDEVAGGALEDLLSPAVRSAQTLNEAVNAFEYQYYLARVRANLKKSAEEFEEYGKNYQDVLGEAVAARIRMLEKEKTDALKAVVDIETAAVNAARGLAGGAAVVDAAVAAAVKRKEFITGVFDTRIKLYRTMQAVDLYMKAVASGLARDPDSVLDIKRMVDDASTTFVANWFTEATGDKLAEAFEYMPTPAPGGDKQAAASSITAARAADANAHYYKLIGAANVKTQLGVPQFTIDADSDNVKNVNDNIREVFKSFKGLKNLINIFARIGDKFGGQELREKTFMTPQQIWIALTDYLQKSALSYQAAAAVNPIVAGLGKAASVDTYQVFFGSVAGTSVAHDDYFKSCFDVEDQYFVMIIKSMAAKVLTVLGVYDMLERKTPINQLTPVRMIVGGGVEADPEIAEGALELYFRLPRLFEFYRGLLGWSSDDMKKNADTNKIAFVPELEGIFSGIIRLIFQKMTSPENGDYSDSELRTLIREVNNIHEHYREKSGERAVQDAVLGAVAEINRRYGIVKREDMEKYWEGFVEESRLSSGKDLTRDIDYAILPGENDIDRDRFAPSDRFASGKESERKEFENTSKYSLDTDFDGPKSKYKLVREFRAKLDKELSLAKPEDYKSVSFSTLFVQAKAELKRAVGLPARFTVAANLIQGNSVVGMDADRAYIFHETVAVGLNVLGGFRALLDSFQKRAAMFSGLEGKVRGRLRFKATGAPIAALSKAVLFADDAADKDNNLSAEEKEYIADNRKIRGRTGEVSLDPARLYTHAQACCGTVNYSLAATTPDQKAKFDKITGPFVRYILDRPKMMKDLLEDLYALVGGSQGLVDLRFPQSSELQLQLDFSKLRSRAEIILVHVKQYFDSMRPHLSDAVITKFEKQNTSGSIFWIEKNLFDRHFRGLGDADRVKAAEFTVEGISRSLNSAFRCLTSRSIPYRSAVTTANLGSGTLTDVTANNVLPATPGEFGLSTVEDMECEQYGSTISGMIFYDSFDKNSGFADIDKRVRYSANIGLDDLIKDKEAAVGFPQSKEAKPCSRWGLYESQATGKALSPYRSLMFSLNQLFARYLQVAIDSGAGNKIYSNMINTVANGIFGQAVNTYAGNSYPDLADKSIDTFGKRGDPKPEALLCSSLALVLRTLLKDVNKQNISKHLVTTLTDVPLYIKESIRANFPVLSRLFDLLAGKCEFLRQIIQKTQLGKCLGRASQQKVTGGAANAFVRVKIGIGAAAGKSPGKAAKAAASAAANAGGDAAAVAAAVAAVVAEKDMLEDGNQYPTGSLKGIETFDSGKSSSAMKEKFVALLDSISSSSFALSNSCGESLRELADSPVYFQTGDGSIESYRMRFNRAPLMPLSLSLRVLADVTKTDNVASDTLLTPGHFGGTADFKFLYGTRALFGKATPITYEQMPGVKATMDAYNSVTTRREQLEPEKYLTFVRAITDSVRYIADARHLRAALSDSKSLFSTNSFQGNQAGGFKGADRTASFAIAASSLQILISVVESSNQDDQARSIIESVSDAPAGRGASNRKEECIRSLIDMSIIPINFHALMSTVPAINLYNYSYTFEQLAASIYGKNMTDLDAVNSTDTRVVFLQLLKDPYMAITEKQFGSDVSAGGTAAPMQRIFRGDNSLGMGRPKFLSDQLFNKSLLGSVYRSSADFDEAGPGVGAGISRGRAGVGAKLPAIRYLREVVVPTLTALHTELASTAAAYAAVDIADTADNNTLRNNYTTAAWNWMAKTNTTIDDMSSNIKHIEKYLASMNVDAAVKVAYVAVIAKIKAANASLGGIKTYHQLIAAQENAVVAAAANGLAKQVASVSYKRQILAFLANIQQVKKGALEAIPGDLGDNVKSALTDIADKLNPAAADAAMRPTRHFTGTIEGLEAIVDDVRDSDDVGPYRTVITYFEGDSSDKVQEVELGTSTTKKVLMSIGRARFNTRVVRNLTFITSVMNVLRLKLHRDLTQNHHVLASGRGIIDPSLTEYGHRSTGPNEVYSDMSYAEDATSAY